METLSGSPHLSIPEISKSLTTTILGGGGSVHNTCYYIVAYCLQVFLLSLTMITHGPPFLYESIMHVHGLRYFITWSIYRLVLYFTDFVRCVCVCVICVYWTVGHDLIIGRWKTEGP